jgi:hypothetical protein
MNANWPRNDAARVVSEGRCPVKAKACGPFCSRRIPRRSPTAFMTERPGVPAAMNCGYHRYLTWFRSIWDEQTTNASPIHPVPDHDC